MYDQKVKNVELKLSKSKIVRKKSQLCMTKRKKNVKLKLSKSKIEKKGPTVYMTKKKKNVKLKLMQSFYSQVRRNNKYSIKCACNTKFIYPSIYYLDINKLTRRITLQRKGR